MAGSLQTIPELMHPVLGLTDFQLYPKLPLYMGRQRGAVPSDTVQSEPLRRFLQMTLNLCNNLRRHTRGTACLLFRNQGFYSGLVYRPRPAVYIHPTLAENLRDPARPLPLQHQKEGGYLYADPCSWYFLSEGQ